MHVKMSLPAPHISPHNLLPKTLSLLLTDFSRPSSKEAKMSVDPMTYEAQFFGFTPQTCMLRIYIAFQDYLFEVMQAVEQVILKKLDGISDSDITPVQIRKCTEKFLSFMKGRFDNLFGRMEQLFLQLILRIPPNILLPEDKSQEMHSYSEEEFQLLQKEIEELQKKYRTELCAKQALLAELEEQKIVQAKLKQTLTLFDELTNVGRDHGISDFRESLVSLVQNSRKLQNIRVVIEKEGERLKTS
ncbi:protein MIS12 homolog isoform X1 [Elephas maximus indicus]|uniref:protein MIS12 homolog isoform X1 n=2 Tax=Elephas maximus indicus TaxID=99487 RepID=UPI00211678E8|nr:protein MIS12 homolog isoform X1 [Elephas maximus indicus]